MEIRIRPVGNDELELFVAAARLPDHQREIRQYLKNTFAAGESSRLPDHLLRRRSARHERTKLRRRPASRRHRNAPGSQ